MSSTDKVKIAGHVTRFTVQKKKKDSELKAITTKLIVEDPKLELLALLGKDPASAEAALVAAHEGGCKIEIPVREEAFVVRWRANKKVLSANEDAQLTKIVYDREDNTAVIEWSEQFDHDVAVFYIDNVCVEHFVEFELEQKTLPVVDDDDQQGELELAGEGKAAE